MHTIYIYIYIYIFVCVCVCVLVIHSVCIVPETFSASLLLFLSHRRLSMSSSHDPFLPCSLIVAIHRLDKKKFHAKTLYPITLCPSAPLPCPPNSTRWSNPK